MNQLTIRKATPDDAIWVFDELGNAAREGHFSPSVCDELQRMGLIVQVIARGVLPILKARDGIFNQENLPADLWVAHFGSAQAGFLLSLYEHSRATPSAVELHLGGVVKGFRVNGVFPSMVRNQMSILPEGTRVYGRCYPGSTAAISSLKKLGFVVSRQGNPIELAIRSSATFVKELRVEGGMVDEK